MISKGQSLRGLGQILGKQSMYWKNLGQGYAKTNQMSLVCLIGCMTANGTKHFKGY